MKLPLECIRCNSNKHIDIRYLHNGETYQLEYHCESYTGGCNFYRILPLNFHPSTDSEFDGDDYAKPCKVCGGYYLGDCKCDPETCQCDGCKVLRDED